MVLNFALFFFFLLIWQNSVIKLVEIAVTVLISSMCREMMHLSYEVFLMYEIWMLIKKTFYILHNRLRLIDYDYYISFIKLLFITPSSSNTHSLVDPEILRHRTDVQPIRIQPLHSIEPIRAYETEAPPAR